MTKAGETRVNKDGLVAIYNGVKWHVMVRQPKRINVTDESEAYVLARTGAGLRWVQQRRVRDLRSLGIVA